VVDPRERLMAMSRLTNLRSALTDGYSVRLGGDGNDEGWGCFGESGGPVFHGGFTLLEPHLRRKAHRLSDRSHLLVAGVLYPALAEVGHIRPTYNTTCGLIDLLAAPLAPVRTTIDFQEGLELLSDVHRIYDTELRAV
jgi:hypothetical protein